MTQTGRAIRVAVVGGGVLGVSTAVHLARGDADVRLVTETQLASGASGRSLSWLNCSAAYSEPYCTLRLVGLERYRAFADRGGSTAVAGYLRMDGGLRWAADGEADDLRGLHQHHLRTGYPSSWLLPDEVRERVPGVDPAVVPAEGALFSPAEGWVDLPSLVADLANELVGLGGRIVTDTGRAEVEVSGDRVTAVTTASGDRLEVDAAVLATGADVPRALRRVGITVPDATAPALLVRTTPVATPLRSVLNTPHVSMRPTPDGCLVMDAGWSEREVTTDDDGSYRVRDETVRRLLEEAAAVLVGGPRLTAASYGVGPKPVPGDGEPVLGPVAGVAGYHVAFTHSGATLGLVAGELLAQEVLTGEPSALLGPFRLDRFAA
ncbi:MAG TPA: FAD-dependent oxidoreductase [Actinomycetales bacterium]|nr:FAD-dependent oxidoreductase [Actinomycetales bacterium]